MDSSGFRSFLGFVKFAFSSERVIFCVSSEEKRITCSLTLKSEIGPGKHAFLYTNKIISTLGRAGNVWYVRYGMEILIIVHLSSAE